MTHEVLTDEEVTQAIRTLGVGSYPTLAGAFKAGAEWAQQKILSKREQEPVAIGGMEVREGEIVDIEAWPGVKVADGEYALYTGPLATPVPELNTEAMRVALYRAAINCGHEIDRDQVVLHYSEKQPGANALAQLADRLLATALTLYGASILQAKPTPMRDAAIEGCAHELLAYARCEEARSRGEDIAETVLRQHGWTPEQGTSHEFMDKMRRAVIAKAAGADVITGEGRQERADASRQMRPREAP